MTGCVTTMREHVERFVAHKRALGHRYAKQERLLLSWADAAAADREDLVRTETMIRWSQQTSSESYARQRLGIGRLLASWLHAEDGRHEVPHPECLGRRRRLRRMPVLPSDAQIRDLMDAALHLPPAGSITPHTVHTIIGLIAVTGLRRAEACSLTMSDLTEDGLTVRDAKFGKSRLVPLSDSAREALHRYLRRRKKVAAACDRLFVLSRGGPISPVTLTSLFIRLARTTGLRGGKGEPGVTLHDLRHRFAVRSLEQVAGTDRDNISRHVLALSTCMGHVGVDSTYWYLHATPELLRHIAEKAEALHSGEASS